MSNSKKTFFLENMTFHNLRRLFFIADSPGEWIQVDLQSPTRVTGVITQGSGRNPQWVRSFNIVYGNSTSTLTTIRDANGDKVH